ncbi:site-specific tyrosine recombinase/integron integrase [Patescibacteria group bacterium]
MTKVSTNTSLSEVMIRYLEYCEVDRNLSQNTIKMYAFYLHDFLTWLKKYLKEDSVKIKDLNIELVKKYRVNLNRRISTKSNQGFKRSTQNTFLVAIRAFLKYLVVEEEIDILPPEKIILGKTEDTLPKVLNEEQLERLFEVQDLSKRSGVRDRTILEMLFSTGLRVSELVSLNIDDVDPESTEFTVMGKGRKIRTVYLSKGARDWLKRYLATRQDNFQPLFIRYSGKKMEEQDFEGDSLRLSVRSIQRLVKKYITRAGISVDATPHTFRHSFATGLLKEGADIRSVQELLGHSSVSTTQIYTHVTNKQLKETHKKFHKDIGGEPAASSQPEDASVSSII